MAEYVICYYVLHLKAVDCYREISPKLMTYDNNMFKYSQCEMGLRSFTALKKVSIVNREETLKDSREKFSDSNFHNFHKIIVRPVGTSHIKRSLENTR